MNRIAAERPKSWKTWAIKNRNAAQWSRVNVITHAGALAGANARG